MPRRPTPSTIAVPKGPAEVRVGRPPGTRQRGNFEDFVFPWQSGAYSVLDFDSTHDGQARKHEPLVRSSVLAAGGILESTHEGQALGDHHPILRYPDFDSPPPGEGMDDGL